MPRGHPISIRPSRSPPTPRLGRRTRRRPYPIAVFRTIAFCAVSREITPFPASADKS